MSDNDLKFTQLHEKASAILEELYDSKGQPEEIDDAFVEEYFKAVRAGLDLSPNDADVEEFAPHSTTAGLAFGDHGLVEVSVKSKGEKFVVDNPVGCAKYFFNGSSQRFGSKRGKGSYSMTTAKGLRQITINTGGSLVIGVFGRGRFNNEHGTGQWTKG